MDDQPNYRWSSIHHEEGILHKEAPNQNLAMIFTKNPKEIFLRRGETAQPFLNILKFVTS